MLSPFGLRPFECYSCSRVFYTFMVDQADLASNNSVAQMGERRREPDDKEAAADFKRRDAS